MLAIFRDLTTDQLLRKAQACEELFDDRPQVWVSGDYLDAAGGALDLGGKHRQVLLPEAADGAASFGMLIAGKKEPVAVTPARGTWGEVRFILPTHQRKREKR